MMPNGEINRLIKYGSYWMTICDSRQFEILMPFPFNLKLNAIK